MVPALTATANGSSPAARSEDVNFADYGEQLTRQSRALKVWLGVRTFGLAAIRAEVDRALDAVADLCAEQGIWLHADAAYGGFATLSPRGRALLAGLGRCDSVALDPHKWLYVPFECGCLLAREPERLRAAFQILPDYLSDVAARTGQVNFADYGEQLTRQSRALKVWLGVRYFGLAALRAEVERAIDLAEHAERLVRAAPGLEVMAPAQLGVLCFRVRPRDVDDPAALDRLNERVNVAVNATGRHLVSSTRLRGTFTLRLCVLGYRTTADDVESLVREVIDAGRRLLDGAAADAGG